MNKQIIIHRDGIFPRHSDKEVRWVEVSGRSAKVVRVSGKSTIIDVWAVDRYLKKGVWKEITEQELMLLILGANND